jgi:hypothetical protein
LHARNEVSTGNITNTYYFVFILKTHKGKLKARKRKKAKALLKHNSL